MPAINFSDEDIKAGFLVKNPGRYSYKVSKYESKPAKSDGSPNYLFVLVGTSGEMESVPVVCLFSSKAKFALLPFIKACNGGKEIEKGVDYNPEDCVGCEVTAMTSRGKRDDGSPINVLNDWAPAGVGV